MTSTTRNDPGPPDLDDGELHPYCADCGEAVVVALKPDVTAHWDARIDDDHSVKVVAHWPPRPAACPWCDRPLAHHQDGGALPPGVTP